MTDKRIEPALSAEQWRDGAYVGDDITVQQWRAGVAGNRRLQLTVRSHPLDSERDFAALIALANAALPDSDPRKITREKVEALRVCAKAWGGMQSLDTERANLAFLDALESYLPPEER